MEIRSDRRIRNTVTAGIAVGAGFLFVASGLTAQGTNLRTGGLEDLRGLIVDRAHNVAVLTDRVSSGQANIDSLTASTVDPALSAQISRLQVLTGLTPLTGPALEITLDDAPRAVGSTLPDNVTPDDIVVHQQDVQAVVNAMWRGGATGIQVMDQRIVSTSAIRCVGNTLLLQGRVYSPPFVVIGVGNVADLQRALDDEPGVVVYKQYVDALDLGWKVSILRETTLPGWQGTLS